MQMPLVSKEEQIFKAKDKRREQLQNNKFKENSKEAESYSVK